MSLNERDFFTEKPEMKPMSLACPQCRHRADYQIKWLRRTKKDRRKDASSDWLSGYLAGMRRRARA